MWSRVAVGGHLSPTWPRGGFARGLAVSWVIKLSADWPRGAMGPTIIYGVFETDSQFSFEIAH